MSINPKNCYRFALPILLASALMTVIACGKSASNSAPAAPPATNTITYTAPSSLSYGITEKLYITNSAITGTSLSPSVTGTVTSYSVSPTLPSGLSLNSASGVISGIPDTVTAAADYTITATGPSGSTTAIINLRVASGYVVNSSGDADDADAGVDGTCATAGGVCTLRAAITEINNTPGGKSVIYLPARTITLTASNLNLGQSMEIIGEARDTVIIDGGNNYNAFLADADNIAVKFSKLTIQNMKITGSGGAYSSNYKTGLTQSFTKMYFKDNQASGAAGALLLIGTGYGSATITDCIFDSNQATGTGGAIDNYHNLTITRSVFKNNTASDGGAMIVYDGTNIISNSTFTGNSVTGNGGAIMDNGAGTITLLNSTVAGNSAAGTWSAGGLNSFGTPYTIVNTILANNTGARDNCSISATSLGGNLVWPAEADCGFNNASDPTPADPLLAAIADNGGSTLSMALQAGSPAINAGVNGSCPTVDARGYPRAATAANKCDIGAFEVQ